MTHPEQTTHLEAGTATEPSLILVMGPQASAFAAALVRLRGNTEIHHAETAAEAIEQLSAHNFDHVLVDNRTDGALTLTIPRLAQLDSVQRITVLAGPNSAETIAAIPGIGQVITPPYNPIEIAASLGIEVRDSRKDNIPVDNDRRAGNMETEAAAEPSDAVQQSGREHPKLVLLEVLTTIGRIIPGLTPLLSMLYKNVALTILAALFFAFVSYGIMIAFFLTSGDWSSPLQLQPGHELVVKAESERSELKIKRNLARQQIAEATNKAAEAGEALLRADALAAFTAGTIDQEIANLEARHGQYEAEIAGLEQILESFGTPSERRKTTARIKADYDRRLITRAAYQSAVLGNAQVERQIADIKSKLADTRHAFSVHSQSMSFLKSLKEQASGAAPLAAGSGQAAFVPLTNQIIEIRQIRSSAKANLAAANAAIPSLTDSLAVLEKGIADLEATPMIRAINQPVNVLFVPYDNLESYGENQPLYACAAALFWCSKVGETGAAISGEISTTHPFFGKPIRGQFVEAKLTDPSAAKEDILHVGRPPFFF